MNKRRLFELHATLNKTRTVSEKKKLVLSFIYNTSLMTSFATSSQNQSITLERSVIREKSIFHGKVVLG